MAEHFFGGSDFGVENGQRWVRHGRKLFFVAASLAGATGVLSAPASASNLCVDTDGDGWGWDGSKTCTDMSSNDVPDSAATNSDDQSLDRSVGGDSDPSSGWSDDQSLGRSDDRSSDPIVAGMANGNIVEIPASDRPPVGDLVHTGSVDIEFDLGTFTRPATRHFYEEQDGSPGVHSVVMLGDSIVDFGPEDDPSVAASVDSDNGTYIAPPPSPQIFESIISQERYAGVTPTQGEKTRLGEVLKAWQRYFQTDQHTDADEREIAQLGLISSLQAYETEARIAGNINLADNAARDVERIAAEYENGLSGGATTARQQLSGLGMGAEPGADTDHGQPGPGSGGDQSDHRAGVESTREAMLRDGTLRRRPGQVIDRDTEQPETGTQPEVDIRGVLPRTDGLPGINDLLGEIDIDTDYRLFDNPLEPLGDDFSFGSSVDLDWSPSASGFDDFSSGSSTGFDSSASASGFDDLSFSSWDDFSF